VALAQPPLALQRRRGFHAAEVLHWWHLLSLDAPTVAALWSWSMARAVRVELPWSAPALLALGTWLIYVADRILDGVHDGIQPGRLRERHFFYVRFRRRFLIAGAIGGLVLLWLVATHMGATARMEDTLLFTVAVAYFCVIHLCGPQSERWFPKEIAVGLVFAAAVAVPAWSRLAGHRLSLVPIAGLFAGLCWLNCVAIEKWERPVIQSARMAGPSHFTTRWAQKNLPSVSGGIALIAAAGFVLSALDRVPVSMTALYLAGEISAGLFLVLDRSRLGSMRLRIAADAALLTPLLLLLVR
jgi:hypothetical protein